MVHLEVGEDDNVVVLGKEVITMMDLIFKIVIAASLLPQEVDEDTMKKSLVSICKVGLVHTEVHLSVGHLLPLGDRFHQDMVQLFPRYKSSQLTSLIAITLETQKQPFATEGYLSTSCRYRLVLTSLPLLGRWLEKAYKLLYSWTDECKSLALFLCKYSRPVHQVNVLQKDR